MTAIPSKIFHGCKKPETGGDCRPGNHQPEEAPQKLLYTLPHKHWIDRAMTAIPRKYITDAKNQKQAVIVDLETFNRMESIIEDNGLAKFMEEAEEDETLSVREAKKHYRSLKKA
jgi:hypothetical protein